MRALTFSLSILASIFVFLIGCSSPKTTTSKGEEAISKSYDSPAEYRKDATPKADVAYSISKKGVSTTARYMDVHPASEGTKVLTSSETTHLKSGSLTDTSISIESGTLTAGEIHDFSKWRLWEDIASDLLEEWQKSWKINPTERYTIQLTTEDNTAVVDADVYLLNEKGAKIWTAKTDNTGKAELWANVFTNKEREKSRLQAVVEHAGKTYPIESLNQFHNGVNTVTLPINCEKQQAIDIAFVVDATGSMRDEIDYLKIELQDIIQRVKDTLPTLNVRLGSVFYRDHGDDYVTRKSDFSEEISKTVAFIQAQEANGGGDFPEAVEDALDEAIYTFQWSEEAVGRFLFLVLDAPPHNNSKVLAKLQELAVAAATKGIKIIPVTGSGIDKSTEYLMRSLSLMTNGTYVFLTDDSGIGNPHIEPTTDSYEVELLNNLLVRLIYQYTYTPDCDEKDLLAINVPQQLTQLNQNEIVEAISWEYYPNPTDGQLIVKVDGELEHLFLTDFAGKIISKHLVPSDAQLQLDLRDLPSGIYFINATQGQQKLTGKVVLARS